MNYLAMGPYCWGKGATREEATKQAKRNWVTIYTGVKRPTDKHFTIYSSEGVFSVDGMGSIESTAKIEKLQTSCLAKEN